ncbi:MAG TPA: glycosyltransferase 87 family protein [Ktedonobacteraceae bacterium]|nr:glycosyltransferase 87 family protein [Ktedonobacteraceae bacterium]
MHLRKQLFTPGPQALECCMLGFLFLLALMLRVSLYNVETGDYTAFLSPWYDFLQAHGGFAALKYNFSNYNPPYLYLLALASYTPIPKIVAIKTISIVFDAVLAIFTYLILRLRYGRSYVPLLGAVVILFAPTIFINSAAWGQSDATYTAFCLGSLYFLLRERPAWSCIFFGIAISFKLQAIFFLPVLFLLLLTRKLPLKFLVLIPVTYLLLLAPAFFAGRDAWSLLTIYMGQINSAGVGGGPGPGTGGGGPGIGGGGPGIGGGRFPFFTSSLTLNAPTFYQWLPTAAPEDWKWAGILLAGMVVILLGFLLVASRKQITPLLMLKFTLVFALAIPFLLPEMHERYFYLADAVSIIYAFYFPRYFYVPVLEQLCSLLSYAPFLFRTQIVNLAYVAFVVLFLTVITLTDLVQTLYPNIQRRAATPDAFSDGTLPKTFDDRASLEEPGERKSASLRMSSE